MSNLPIAAMHRIAKKAGAQRIGEDAAELMVKKGESYLANVVTKAIELANHAGRKTIRGEDIELAAEGTPLVKKPQEKQSTIPAVPPEKKEEPPASSTTAK